MKVLLWSTAIIVALTIAAALALPCAACKKRRERLEQAYAEWRRRKGASSE